MFIDLDFPYRIADESSTHPFWRMNFNKYNKFKSHLDINDTKAFSSHLPAPSLNANSRTARIVKFLWDFGKSKSREKRRNERTFYCHFKAENFGIYELEMDQRLSVSDELSMKLMADYTSESTPEWIPQIPDPEIALRKSEKYQIKEWNCERSISNFHL